MPVFSIGIVRDQPPPQALRFSHGRGERETRVTGDEPQGTMGRVSFPPSFARTFSSKERRLGTRQVQDSFYLLILYSEKFST